MFHQRRWPRLRSLNSSESRGAGRCVRAPRQARRLSAGDRVRRRARSTARSADACLSAKGAAAPDTNLGARMRKQSVGVKQLADFIHPLPPPPDYTPRARAARRCALLGSPVLSTSGASKQRTPVAMISPSLSPASITAQPHEAIPRSMPRICLRSPSMYPNAPVHNQKMIIDETALSFNNACVRGNRLESHGKVVYH